VGRNNWTFFGSDRGGRTAAVLRSFVASCELVKVDPFAWFHDVLLRIAAFAITCIKAITPLRSRTAFPPRGPRSPAIELLLLLLLLLTPHPGTLRLVILVPLAAAPNQPLVSTILPSTEPAARSSRACLASRSANVRLTRGSIFFSARSAKILGRSSRSGLASL